jgi:hypothetical protein
MGELGQTSKKRAYSNRAGGEPFRPTSEAGSRNDRLRNNKYQYLYDPDVTNKQDVEVGYNNRCYAYMQLGELKKALDDCTASLKYGSVPDAYRKQQELTRRLNVQQGG